MTGGRGSIVLACLFSEGFCLAVLVAVSDPPLNSSLAAVLWAERPALYPPASNPTQPISSNIMNGKRVSLPVRKGLAYLQTVADNCRQFGSPYPLLSLPANCLLLSGVEASLAAASSRDKGAQRWGPKSSPRGEEGCSLAGESFLCVSLPYDVLRRLLRGNLRYTAKASSPTDSFCARARRGRATSAGGSIAE